MKPERETLIKETSPETSSSLQKAYSRALRARIEDLTDCKKDAVRRIAQGLMYQVVLERVLVKLSVVPSEGTARRTVAQAVNETVTKKEVDQAISRAGRLARSKPRRKAGRKGVRRAHRQVYNAHRGDRFVIPVRAATC